MKVSVVTVKPKQQQQASISPSAHFFVFFSEEMNNYTNVERKAWTTILCTILKQQLHYIYSRHANVKNQSFYFFTIVGKKRKKSI